MLVTPTGGRLWRFRYRIGGVEKLLALGAYPDVPLKRAREKRDQARTLVADGVDPMAKRREARAARLDTFELIASEWLELQRKALAPETMQILGTRLKSFLYPYIGSRPVRSLTAQELLAALRRIEARGKHETAHRVRALAGRVLRFAVATGRADHDVAADLKDALAPSCLPDKIQRRQHTSRLPSFAGISGRHLEMTAIFEPGLIGCSQQT